MPDKKEIDRNEIKMELIAPDRLEGNYTVSKSIVGQIQVSSGIIKKVKDGTFQLLITGKSSPKVYKLDFNSDKMIFVSGELGNGAIHYDKDLDKIYIKGAQAGQIGSVIGIVLSTVIANLSVSFLLSCPAATHQLRWLLKVSMMLRLPSIRS